jgi:hypothetical protein
MVRGRGFGPQFIGTYKQAMCLHVSRVMTLVDGFNTHGLRICV